MPLIEFFLLYIELVKVTLKRILEQLKSECFKACRINIKDDSHKRYT